MVRNEPTASDIRAANRNAVGGGRKRCTRGKNCSATCIDAGKDCLVGLPEPVSVATSKVSEMLQARQSRGSRSSPSTTPPAPMPTPPPPQAPETKIPPASIQSGAKEEQKGYRARQYEKDKGATLEVEAKGSIGKNTTFDPKFFQARIDSIPESDIIKMTSGKQREKLIKSAEKALGAKLERAERNREFLDKLQQNSPEGTKITAKHDLVVMAFKTKSGDLVTTEFSPEIGYVFRVNGDVDAGTVKGRKAQMEVSSAVRRQYDALVQSLPVGSIVKASAYTDDGKGAQRQKLYERVGFSSAKPGKDIFSIKGEDGTMTPLPATAKSERQLMKQDDDPRFIFFVEGNINQLSLDEVWEHIVFG